MTGACGQRWSKAMSPSNTTLPNFHTIWPDASPHSVRPSSTPSAPPIGAGLNGGPPSNEPLPSFPPSHTPDFLRSLTQVSESVGRSSEFVNVGKVLGGSPAHVGPPHSDVNGASGGGLRAHASPGTPQCPPGSNGPLTPASLPPSCPGSVSQTSTGVATAGSNMAPGSNETSQRTPATGGGDHASSAVGLDFDPMAVIDGDNQDMMNVSVYGWLL